MPRRRFLRMIGGMIAAAAIPGLRPSRADAAPGITAVPDVIDPPKGPWGEPIPCGETSFGPRICDPTSNCVKCCHADGKPVSCCPCYVTCRPSGLCGEPFACGPDGRPYCGAPGVCCPPNEFCFRGSVCVPICKTGEMLCDDQCCPKGTECVQLTLPGQRGRLLCAPKCPKGRTRCGLVCCPRGHKCRDATRGICAQCDPGQQPCGKKCCPRGSSCCDPRTGLCCRRRSETCAGFAGQAKCCPKGTRACKTDPRTGKPICCKKGETCAELGDPSGTVPAALRGKYSCCPPERTVTFSGGAALVCCPVGYRSLGGRFILPAGGGGGLCCREDKVCGSTCCGTNADPGIDQTCCNGTCVSLYFDPQNCGGCGRACAPGQRCNAGTCVPA
jgi:hypothetical protein